MIVSTLRKMKTTKGYIGTTTSFEHRVFGTFDKQNNNYKLAGELVW